VYSNWGPDTLNPSYKGGDEVARQPIVARGGKPQVFQSTKTFSMRRRSLCRRLLRLTAAFGCCCWEYRLGSATLQPQTQTGAVVVRVAPPLERPIVCFCQLLDWGVLLQRNEAMEIAIPGINLARTAVAPLAWVWLGKRRSDAACYR
jgi:hypothetical protein